MMSVMAINGSMYENRHKFLIFLRSMLEMDISQEETSDFYMNGFLPIEWLDALFERTLTFDQYHYINDMMEQMYPPHMSVKHVNNRHSVLYSMSQKRSQKLDDYEDDLLHEEENDEEKPIMDSAITQPQVQSAKKIKSHKCSSRKNHPWSQTLVKTSREPTSQKKHYKLLSDILAEIFDLACKRSRHQSGSCVDFQKLKNNIENILPDHRIEVDIQSRIITLFDENDVCIGTHRVPTDFPSIRLQ